MNVNDAPQLKVQKSFFRQLFYSLAVMALLLTASELYLYSQGWRCPDANRLEANHIDEAACGWLPKPGVSYSRENPSALTTVWPNSQRASGPDYPPAPPHTIVLGCSYTFGMGVADQETFVYRLNAHHPNWAMANSGVIGYGTYQAWLRLKEMAESGQLSANHTVIYCFIGDHLQRNIMPRIFGKSGESADFVSTPYWDYSKTPPQEHPLQHLGLPGEHLLVTIAFLSRCRAGWAGEASKKAAFDRRLGLEAYHDIVEKMSSLCQQRGWRFYAVGLDSSRDPLEEWASQNGCYKPTWAPDWIDANYPDLALPVNHVAHNPAYHPAANVHAFWSEKIAQALLNSEKTRSQP